jgi:hypothetical protein
MWVSATLIGLALAGCSATQRTGGAQPAPAHEAERACHVARAGTESSECFAVRCAEDFLRRNGYTMDAAAGPLARESVRSPTLEERRGMLERSAFGYRPFPPGHLVVFKYSNSTGRTARAVTMSGAFDALRVEHQDFFLSAAGPMPNCASGGPG